MKKPYSKLTITSLKDILTVHTASMMIMVTVSGTVFAYYQTHKFNIPLFVAMVAASFFALLGTNALNNYSEAIEFKHGDNKIRHYILSEPTSVVSHNVDPRIALFAGILCYTLVAIAGLYIMHRTTWYLIVPGIFGFFVGITYANGPFPLVKTPTTEILSGICVGGFIFYIAYYIQALRLDTMPMIAALIVTFAVSLVNCNNHLCDAERDALTNRGTVATRYGKKTAILQIKIFFFLVYLSWIALGLFNVFGVFSLFCILPMLVALKYLHELEKLKEPQAKNKMGLEKFVVLHVFLNVVAIIIASICSMVR